MCMFCDVLFFWEVIVMLEILMNVSFNEAYVIGIFGKIYVVYFFEIGVVCFDLFNFDVVML